MSCSTKRSVMRSSLLLMSPHLLLQASDEGCRRAGSVLFVLVRKPQHFLRPRFRHGVMREYLGEIGDKRFFSDIGLRTASRRLFRTAIIGMAFLFFGGDHTATLAAPEQATQGFRFFVRSSADVRARSRALHFVKQLLGDERRMLALVYLVAIAKMAVVKRVGKNESHSVFVQRVPSKLLTPLSKRNLEISS